MAKHEQQEPLKASHRFMMKVLQSSAAPVKYDPAAFDKVVGAFNKAGHSWVALFQGSSEEVDFLKRLLVVAVKKKVLTTKNKKPKKK